VRGTAEVEFDLAASFAPKPFLDAIGSGAHVHFSLWSADGHTNLLHNPDDPQSLSDFGLSFVAGLLDHLPALVAVTCPSYNSYARLMPDAWAGSTVAWGYDNRECTVRVASPFRGREASSINIELKASDSSANPYLTLAAILRAGLDGVQRGLRPPKACSGNPAHLSPADMEECGIAPLPADQMEAHRLLTEDSVLVDALGQKMVDALVALRGAEYRAAKAMGDKAAAEKFFPLL
jgi:glutamine synthetase